MEHTRSPSEGYFCRRSIHSFSCIYGCLAANTIWFPQSSSGALPLKMGPIFYVETSVLTLSLYNAQNPKRTQISSIYRFLMRSFTLARTACWKWHNGNRSLRSIWTGSWPAIQALHSHVTAPSRCLADSGVTRTSGGTHKVRCCRT